MVGSAVDSGGGGGGGVGFTDCALKFGEAHLLQGLPGGGLDLGVRVRERLGELRHNGGQRGRQRLGGQVGHGPQHLHAALLAAPRPALHARHQRRQHQLHACAQRLLL